MSVLNMLEVEISTDLKLTIVAPASLDDRATAELVYKGSQSLFFAFFHIDRAHLDWVTYLSSDRIALWLEGVCIELAPNAAKSVAQFLEISIPGFIENLFAVPTSSVAVASSSQPS